MQSLAGVGEQRQPRLDERVGREVAGCGRAADPGDRCAIDQDRISDHRDTDVQLVDDECVAVGAEADPAADQATRAAAIVERFVAARAPVPGIGHPIHKPTDPRAERLVAIMNENGLDGPEIPLVREVARQAGAALGKDLPVNVTGAIGAIASRLGIDWRAARGIGVMARAVGLVGHVLEEIHDPAAPAIWHDVEEAAADHRGGGG